MAPMGGRAAAVLMPTSAIGSRRAFRRRNAQGFTLLEILLVLAIIAVVSALVVPNYLAGVGQNLHDEARRLARLLQLASEEAELTGNLLRWTAYSQRYEFAMPNAEGEWRRLHRQPFQARDLPAGIRIVALQRQDRSAPVHRREKDYRGEVIFYPNGLVDEAELRLAQGREQVVIRLQPGMGGIRVQP